jgi:hypothetical protein
MMQMLDPQQRDLRRVQRQNERVNQLGQQAEQAVQQAAQERQRATVLQQQHPEIIGNHRLAFLAYVRLATVPIVYALDFLLLAPGVDFLITTAFGDDPTLMTLGRFIVPALIILLELAIGAARLTSEDTPMFWGWVGAGVAVAFVPALLFWLAFSGQDSTLLPISPLFYVVVAVLSVAGHLVIVSSTDDFMEAAQAIGVQAAYTTARTTAARAEARHRQVSLRCWNEFARLARAVELLRNRGLNVPLYFSREARETINAHQPGAIQGPPAPAAPAGANGPNPGGQGTAAAPGAAQPAQPAAAMGPQPAPAPANDDQEAENAYQRALAGRIRDLDGEVAA